MLKNLTKQYKVPWIGGFIETLSEVAFFVSMVNFVMIGATFYFTTLRFIAPWFTLPMFATTVVVLVLLGVALVYKFLVPSIWMFRGKQMFEHESQISDKLDEIIRRLEKLEEKVK